MLTILAWWFVVGYFPTSFGAALMIASGRRYKARHGAPGRRRARTSTWEQAAGIVVDSPEVRVARVKVEATAEALLNRSRSWNEGPSLAEVYLGIDDVESVVELERHEPSAGAVAYLDLPRAVGRAKVPDALSPDPTTVIEAVEPDLDARRAARITTAEMRLQFGDRLGPVLGKPEVDEWALPDEDGEDPGTGRHTRRRRGRVEAGVT